MLMYHSTRVEVVRWVAEEKRPFLIVADKCFHVLMKTGPGRSQQYIPSPAIKRQKWDCGVKLKQ